MTSALHWFEIPATDLERAQRFYETVLGCTLHREAMGPGQGAVFPYQRDSGGIGGALLCGPNASAPSERGTLIYLDGGASLDATLSRVEAAGGKLALGRQALPPGMGFFAHIIDTEGNRVGLHTLA